VRTRGDGDSDEGLSTPRGGLASPAPDGAVTDASWCDSVTRLEGSLLEGETEFIRESPCQLAVPRGTVAGLLACTSYRLRFAPLTRRSAHQHLSHVPLAALSVPLLSIRSVARGGGTPDCPAPTIDVVCKDFRSVRLCFSRDRECEQVLRLVQALAFPASIDEVFAFTAKAAASKRRRAAAAAPTARPAAAPPAAAAPHAPAGASDPLGVTPPPAGAPAAAVAAPSAAAPPSAPGSDADAANPFAAPAPADAASASSSSPPSAGWALFDFERELARIGAVRPGDTPSSSPWRLTRINEEYRFSPTYPSVMAVPAAFSDREISSIRQFRSRGRIPALTWRHPVNGATMWRSAQPRVGVTNATNSVDERLLSLIRTSTPQGRDGRVGLVIADCRPKTNAIANKMAGWGYEGATYEACSLWFLDIENIHRMRESSSKLEALALAHKSELHWGKAVEATVWPSHVRTVLAGAMRVAQALHRRAAPVLVHCSDGWDRTAQICGLVQLLLDPFARTVEGFASLIEKEWLAFGHKFQCRLAHGSAKAAEDKEASPVFAQFLDCAYQLAAQFPAAFEWSTRLPLFLLHHCTSGRFGTFLFNCERERRVALLHQRTASVWDAVLDSRGLFLSPLYRPSAFGVGGTHPAILPSHPAPVLRQVHLWSDAYLRFSPVPGTSPLQGARAALLGGGAAAARALCARLEDVVLGLAPSLPAQELPVPADRGADSPADGGADTALARDGGRDAVVAALRALSASGMAAGADDALVEVMAAVLCNASLLGRADHVPSSSQSEPVSAGADTTPGDGTAGGEPLAAASSAAVAGAGLAEPAAPVGAAADEAGAVGDDEESVDAGPTDGGAGTDAFDEVAAGEDTLVGAAAAAVATPLETVEAVASAAAAGEDEAADEAGLAAGPQE